ncbi:hypothetical protein S7711_10517 [Stachybotrys chartarum IBT 7711]|uniref:Uncharacterized protein n=1 Tax=Stachybotrys chartarum (strain CBS 109288 / IBT 7711) TaxID=1280523 RepID=A0A084AJ44_STACB|nr:hypothetical protein S7711_10517 [Stachybotrys chartarum IBT 7711]
MASSSTTKLLLLSIASQDSINWRHLAIGTGVLNTSSMVVYDTSHPLHVTAGIGPPDLGLTVLPNSYAVMVGMLAMNPLITTTSSSVACNDTRCTSYLMAGGLESVTPWIPEGYREYSLATIRRMPSIQLDIIPSNDYVFQKEDSDVFGLFVCPNGAGDNDCRAPSAVLPNITVTASFYAGQASIVAARSNYSIVSVPEKTHPSLIRMDEEDILAYRDAFRWLLNCTAAGMPAPSSIAEIFWSSSVQLQSQLTSGVISQNFHGLLAFAFWL